MKPKAIKPRQMWAHDVDGGTHSVFPKRDSDGWVRPVLVIDLSPESVWALFAACCELNVYKTRLAGAGYVSDHVRINPDDVKAVFATLGIKAAKGRKP